MLRLPVRTRLHRLVPTLTRASSGSPSPTVPDNHFIKTGKREASDPTAIHLRSEEYSQSGGDDMVAEQTIASFSKDADSTSSKVTAGKGNVVNPLEFSPASPELSKITEAWVEKGVERTESMRTGQGVTRKSKTVVRSEIDFDTVKHKTGGG